MCVAAPAKDERRFVLAELCHDAGQVVVQAALKQEVVARLRVAAHMRDQLYGPHVLAVDQQALRRHVQPLRDVAHVGNRGGHGHIARVCDRKLRPEAPCVAFSGCGFFCMMWVACRPFW